MKLKGRVVMITGASEGIGAAIAQAFANRGAILVLNSLDGAKFPIAAGEGVLHIPGDITDGSVRNELVSESIRRFGAVDVLVNNVGVGLYGYPSTVSVELSKRMFDVNVFAPLSLTQSVIALMKERRSGFIVNIGSVGGHVSLPWAVMYCSTKWVVHAIDDSLRRELSEFGIRVLKVCPGIVDTKFRDHVLGGHVPSDVADIRRVVTAAQVAEGTVKAVERDARIVYVPKIGRLFRAMDYFAPSLMDWYLKRKSSPIGPAPDA